MITSSSSSIFSLDEDSKEESDEYVSLKPSTRPTSRSLSHKSHEKKLDSSLRSLSSNEITRNQITSNGNNKESKQEQNISKISFEGYLKKGNGNHIFLNLTFLIHKKIFNGLTFLKCLILISENPNGLIKIWKNRYFILKDSLLYYFEDKNKCENPLGYISLSHSKRISFSENSKNSKQSLFFTFYFLRNTQTPLINRRFSD